MAEAVVSLALEKLINLLSKEGKFLHGVGDQVQSLQTELKLLHSLLKDADARRNESQFLKDWVAEIREITYDAEDIIETYVLQVDTKSVTKKIGGIYQRRKVGSEIEKLTTKISQLANNLKSYGIIALKDKEGLSSLSVSKRERRQSFAHIIEPNVVGLDDCVKELVGVLTDETNHSRVVSIHGMGGLGKTTLAKEIYHHSQIKQQFKLLAWTSISQQCQRRDVWAAIYSKLTRSKSESLGEDELAEKLYNFLKDNKCLVVLDDIWYTETWERLEAAFPKETSSKILLTSRNKQVAVYADRDGHHLQPQCLKDEDSWELFRKIVFVGKNGEEFRVDESMEELGKQMVKRCAGLPLAITVLGGLLRQNINLNHWQKVQANLTSYIIKDHNNREKHSAMDDVFSLSYDSLSPELKQCFLYLGHFPEDYDIPVEKLIRFWIAEGMIPSMSQKREDVEIVAEEFFDELIERSMVLVGKYCGPRGVFCRLHDIMRDLCLQKVKEDNFLEVIDLHPQDEYRNTFSFSTLNVRRLAVHLYNLNKENRIFHHEHIKSPHLRSLLYLANHKYKLLELNFKKLKMLRILDLERVKIEGGKLSDDIGKLVHLRFLSLRYSNVVELPSSLGNLRLLETLDLYVWEAVYVPNVLWKMESLRHLYLPHKLVDKTNLNLDTLTNLRTLERFQLGFCNINDLLHMPNLRRLTIANFSQSKDFREIMPVFQCSVLKNLQFLSLKDSSAFEKIGKEDHTPVDLSLVVARLENLSELVLYWKITKLPESYLFLLKLTNINLGSCGIKEDPMRILETLPELIMLTICWDGYIGGEMVCSATGFFRLEFLELSGLRNLKYWKLEDGGMRNLRTLEIELCRNLKNIPNGLKCITTLKELTIEGMTKSFNDNLVEGGDDYHKVQHVPSIYIRRDLENIDI